MKIAILTRPDYRSPRVLAESLKAQLENQKVYVEIFFDINLLTRLVEYKESKLSFHFWLKERLAFYLKDRKVLHRLYKFDAILISECTPNGFRKSMYNVERLRWKLKKPILYYEVYYLGNAPSQIELLTKSGDSLFDRYDLHLSVAEVTEIRQGPSGNWFSIGIFAKSLNLFPKPKNDVIAIVDFVQPGYEAYREIQLRALERAGIKYISLEKKYSFEEIRKIYQAGAIFFLQFPEAFGLPVLECLCCGNQVFTPLSGWPMAWRLNEQPGDFR